MIEDILWRPIDCCGCAIRRISEVEQLPTKEGEDPQYSSTFLRYGTVEQRCKKHSNVSFDDLGQILERECVDRSRALAIMQGHTGIDIGLHKDELRETPENGVEYEKVFKDSIRVSTDFVGEDYDRKLFITVTGAEITKDQKDLFHSECESNIGTDRVTLL